MSSSGLKVFFGETEGSGVVLSIRVLAGADLVTSGSRRGISSVHACFRVLCFVALMVSSTWVRWFQFFGLVVVGQVGCGITWWRKYCNRMNLRLWFPIFKSLTILPRSTQRRWMSLCCSAFLQTEICAVIWEFSHTNAAGMTNYYTPIEYEHIHLVFATLGCVYKIWWSQLVHDSAYNEVTPTNFAFWSFGTLVQSITF